MLIAAFSLNDPIELWLETIKYCSEGMRVEVIPAGADARSFINVFRAYCSVA